MTISVWPLEVLPAVVQLARYRMAHKIEPIREWDEDHDRTITVCAHDLIRVHPKSPTDSTSPLVHDQGYIAFLVKRERGE